MTIIVAANNEQWEELTTGRTAVSWERVANSQTFSQYTNADAFFCLDEDFNVANFNEIIKPVFINAVSETLINLKTPQNVLRINGWRTFLSRSTWEITGKAAENIDLIFEKLGIKINFVADEPGFISARVLAMVINEAYFTVSDNVSSKNEIDTAMKLGTNYPYGPFEWAGLIGPENILTLLQKLNVTSNRYTPASLLITEVMEKNK